MNYRFYYLIKNIVAKVFFEPRPYRPWVPAKQITQFFYIITATIQLDELVVFGIGPAFIGIWVVFAHCV